MTNHPERLTAFEYGITPAARLRPATSTVDIDVFDRPHPSPAMERALQRIETEIPARIRALRANGETPATEIGPNRPEPAGPWSITAIHDGWAWCHATGSKSGWPFPLSDLTPATGDAL